MTEYKDGDKVVVRLVGADEMQELTGIKVGSIMGCPILGKLEDFQPAEEKIKMTVEEKKEFDELMHNFLDHPRSVYEIMLEIFEMGTYQLLQAKCSGSFEEQLNLLKCIENSSLIEVIKPEHEFHEFKLGDLVEVNGEKGIILRIVSTLEAGLLISSKRDGCIDWARKEDATFIKSNAINWEDGE